ncbi:BAG domain [Musa troglodytarum]|uniref:BAG domain n=1 Tax=Musa troglodytarum TaxID=320322 RepID=A0A9E7L867_9LILI|nr:BAG domain [Musa troglodytarum]
MESPFFYSVDPWSAAGRRYRHIESPFFYSADPWSAAGRHHHHHHHHHPHCPVPVFTANPRVVSIPVHFDGSDEVAAVMKPARVPPSEAVRSSAAVAVQRIFRGHMVRKNVRVVSRIATEVEEIERRVCSEMERLRADPKERLLVGEMLMALLLRLDSVRGVREYRKKTIRRVIALEAVLDSISAQTLEASNPIDSEPPISAEMQPDNREEVEETPHEDDSDGANTEEASAQECQDPDSNAAHESASQASQDPVPEAKDEGFVLVTVEEATGTPLSKAKSGAKCVDGDVVTDKTALSDSMEQENREKTTAPAEEAPEMSTAGWHMTEDSVQAMAEPRNDSKDASGMGEVAKKVMAENERLQVLLAALFERSAQQCRLMAGLVERAGQLERAVHRMEKKKAKKMRANCPPHSPVDKKVDNKVGPERNITFARRGRVASSSGCFPPAGPVIAFDAYKLEAHSALLAAEEKGGERLQQILIPFFSPLFTPTPLDSVDPFWRPLSASNSALGYWERRFVAMLKRFRFDVHLGF